MRFFDRMRVINGENFKKFFLQIELLVFKPVFLIIFFLISVYIHKFYRYGISDHNEQIPIIMRIIDGTYLINDWFVNQNINFSPRFFYSVLLSSVSNFLGIPFTYYVIYIATIILLTYSIYRLSNLIFDNKIIPIVILILVLFLPRTSLGGNWLTGSILVPSSIAIPLILMAIYYSLYEKIKISYFILGLITIIHPQLGVLALSLIFISNILIKYKEKEMILNEIISFLVYYFPLGIIGLLPVIINSSNASDFQIFETITYVRHPHHYCPFSFPLFDYFKFFIVFSLFLIALSYNIKPKNTSIHIKILIIITLIIIYCLIGTIFVEIFPVLFIAKLQMFRLTPILILLMYIYIINFFYQIFVSKILDLFNNINLFYTKIKSSIYNNKNLTTLFIAIIILINITLIATVNYFPIANERTNTYSWIKNNTLNNSLFLIPPTIEDFRLGANRAIVVDWKAFPFNDESVLGWRERIEDVSNFARPININRVQMGYNTLNESRILSLKDKYKFDYVIMMKEFKLNLSEVYSDKLFRIYQFEK